MHDACSGAHVLHVSSLNEAVVSGRILVLELPPIITVMTCKGRALIRI